MVANNERNNIDRAVARVPFAVETYEDIEARVAFYFAAEDAHVDFEAFEIIGGSENIDGSDVFMFEGVGGCGFDDKATNDITKANKYIHGTIKWDGCSHVYFGDEGYIHLCGPEHFKKLGALLAKVYQRCYEIGGFWYAPLTPLATQTTPESN